MLNILGQLLEQRKLHPREPRIEVEISSIHRFVSNSALNYV